MIAFVVWPWENPAKWLIVRLGAVEIKVTKRMGIRVKKVTK